MANNIQRSQKYLQMLDEIYKMSSKTEVLDAQTQPDFTNANAIKVLKVETTGLGDYDKDSGYPKGDVTATWESMTLSQSRGKEISIDRMDDEETLGMTFGTVTSKFVRDHVSPEVDAYRFAKYAQAAGTVKPEDLTAQNVLDAIDAALYALNANEVPEGDRYLFMDFSLQALLGKAVDRSWMNEDGISRELVSYNGVPIIWVPASRFYTEISMNSGIEQWGYSKAEDGEAINFLLVQKDAVVQATKLALPKIFSPDENQDKDAWKFQFRLYHDAFAHSNKSKGIYLSRALAE
ncbi:MAG: hypothetical protein ACOX8S_01770 [Christensenellales bacterium]|jgi:hypothetical protein